MTLESWSMGIVRPIMESYPLAWIFFIIFIFVATFIMVNLIVAIVVDAMAVINAQEHQEQIHSSQDIIQEVQSLKEEIQLLQELIQKNNS